MTFDLTDTPLVTLDGGVLSLPVSLDGKGNALDSDALAASDTALTALLAGDVGRGGVLLRGLGANFCAGGHVAGFAAAGDRSEQIREVGDLLHGMIRRLDELSVPVVAGVGGWAAGAGLSLALA